MDVLRLQSQWNDLMAINKARFMHLSGVKFCIFRRLTCDYELGVQRIIQEIGLHVVTRRITNQGEMQQFTSTKEKAARALRRQRIFQDPSTRGTTDISRGDCPRDQSLKPPYIKGRGGRMRQLSFQLSLVGSHNLHSLIQLVISGYCGGLVSF